LSAPTPPATRRGVRLFNAGRYLSAQQVWEEAWREAPPEERAFLEALVQLAGGLHLRTRRGATRGAVQLMSQALILLDDYQPAMHGIDVTRLVGEFAAYAEAVKASKRPHRLLDRFRIPRIH
jgi:predicted metal-dependent hydrolase